jgi:hypothetical protein
MGRSQDRRSSQPDTSPRDEGEQYQDDSDFEGGLPEGSTWIGTKGVKV